MTLELSKKKEYVKRLRSLHNSDDYKENVHADADDVLCEILIDLGCQDVVDEFNKVKKWYDPT